MARNSCIPLYGMLVLGIALLVAGSAELWFGLQADEVADRARLEMSDAGLATHRGDFETARDLIIRLDSEVLPRLATTLGVSPEQFRKQVAADYPAIGALLDQQAELLRLAEESLVNLERQQHDFERADSLPVAALPRYAGGILKLALGLVVIAGAVMVVVGSDRSRVRVGLATVGIAAVVLIALPLALRVPEKARSAENVLDSLDASTAAVARSTEALATADRARNELDNRLIPDMAGQFGVSAAQFKVLLAIQFPNVGLELAELPRTLGHYHTRVDILTASAADLRALERLPVGAFGWFDPAVGVVLGLVTAVAWFACREVGIANPAEPGPASPAR